MHCSAGKRSWHTSRLVGEAFVLDILQALAEGPKRFVDLHESCPNERTRTAKLRKLEEENLVQTTSMKVGKRFFIHYTLTEKGKRILQQAIEMEK